MTQSKRSANQLLARPLVVADFQLVPWLSRSIQSIPSETTTSMTHPHLNKKCWSFYFSCPISRLSANDRSSKEQPVSIPSNQKNKMKEPKKTMRWWHRGRKSLHIITTKSPNNTGTANPNTALQLFAACAMPPAPLVLVVSNPYVEPFQQYLSKHAAQMPLRATPVRLRARSTTAHARQAGHSGSVDSLAFAGYPCVPMR